MAALLVLVVWGLALPSTAPTGQPGSGDAALYRIVADRVARGESYYAAASTEQRHGGYPIRPFTAIRPPALAELGATLGPHLADAVLRLLTVAVAVATGMRFFVGARSPVREIGLSMAASSTALVAMPGMWVWHELWAGLLIALALACRTERRWHLAVAFGLAAAIIRELALPFLPMMAIVAWSEGRKPETAGWGIATLLAVCIFAIHAVMAIQVATPVDKVSPGWLALGGLGFDLALARHSALLLMLPGLATAIALPLALLGWIGWRNGYAIRVCGVLAIWLGAFLFVGRPDNDYWGFLLAPLLPVGLALAPAAIRDLIGAAMPLPLPGFPAKHRAHGHSIRPLDPRAS